MIFISTDILSPYKREIVSQDSYKTLIDFLQDKYPNGFKRPTDVSINGIEIAIDDYDIKLNDIDVVVLLDRAALPATLIGGWFITALANLAISVTLSYVANKLFAPDAPEEQAQPSSVYNLNSAQNMARFGSPIPIIYGKVRMFPAMIVQPFYRYIGNIEYLYHVLCVGQGTNTTDQILISDDEITSTGDLEWKLLYHDDFYDIPTRGLGVHITNTLTTPSNMKLINDTANPEYGESEKYKISKDASKVEIDYLYPSGLSWVKSDGSYTDTYTSFRYRIYTYSGTTYTLVGTNIIGTNAYSVDAIQKTFSLDTSAYIEDIYISFEKIKGDNDSRTTNDTYIKRVKEIFPNEDFTHLYGDITLLVCKIKSTNAVSAAGQVKVNGYFERTDVGNTMAEVLTDIYTNTGYGGGLSADDLSFPTTTETVNCAYDSNMTIFDAMRKPALAQGYSLYLAGMDVILKKDGANALTSGMYNEMNILSNSLKVQYLFKEEFPSYDGFECTYIDGDGWIPRTERYPSTSIRPQVVDLFGVVDYNQINEPRATQDGWYTVELNSDTYGDYDIDTLAYTGGSFFGSNPTYVTVSAGLDLQTTGFYISNFFKSNALSTTSLGADRNFLDETDGNYRCLLTWDKATRTWDRTDNVDYYLHPVNQVATHSISLGVCTSDPRFLVPIGDPSEAYNSSGVFPEYPKTGIIWLFDGEQIGGT